LLSLHYDSPRFVALNHHHIGLGVILVHDNLSAIIVVITPHGCEQTK
jgi:hypothetical protein